MALEVNGKSIETDENGNLTDPHAWNEDVARALAAKKANMANASDVERSTGYVLGGVSPLGQKKKLQTVIDSSALGHATIFVSAGRRGLEIELKPKDLLLLTNGKFAEIAQ